MLKTPHLHIDIESGMTTILSSSLELHCKCLQDDILQLQQSRNVPYVSTQLKKIINICLLYKSKKCEI